MERVHKLSAAVVFAFLCLHFATHFAGLLGADIQQQVLEALRLIYRQPWVEGAVLAAFAIQLITGVPLILEIWSRKKDFVHQVLAVSGLGMALFVLLHVASALAARFCLQLDTNFALVTASLTSPKWRTAFLVFYGAGLMSLFVHMGCIAYGVYKKHNKPIGWTLLVVMTILGAYVTWLLLRMYSGHLYPIEVPPDYSRLFAR